MGLEWLIFIGWGIVGLGVGLLVIVEGVVDCYDVVV